jgi:hypothetical protein
VKVCARAAKRPKATAKKKTIRPTNVLSKPPPIGLVLSAANHTSTWKKSHAESG